MPEVPRDASIDLSRPLVVGFGVAGRAVARQLTQRGYSVSVLEDNPTDELRTAAHQLGVNLVERPDEVHIKQSLATATVLLPSPGVPDRHRAIQLANETLLPIRSEFDLARAWDDRPVVSITGTNGKTSVTMMVTDALQRSGFSAAAVGNTDVPLVSAIEDATIDIFVVEASSFRLGHTARFCPRVATWLNFAPDHLDAHASLASYERAKAQIWQNLAPDGVAIANADDPTVMANLDRLVPPPPHPASDGGGRRVLYSTSATASASGVDWYVDYQRAELRGPDGFALAVASLARRRPHDVSNALAVLATAAAAGARVGDAAAVVSDFAGLPHRMQFVAGHDGIEWYNDSKATVPEAAAAAISGFASVVLIAGGRNKGLDLSVLGQLVPPVRAVVATGDAAGEIAAIFDGRVPVTMASSMVDAVAAAADISVAGDAVLLSPGCTSFDWYANYGARGDDFMMLVNQQIGKT